MSASPKGVCVPCRRVYGGEGRRTVPETQAQQMKRGGAPFTFWGTGWGQHVLPPHCPICRGPLRLVSHTWRAPRRRNLRAWRRLERRWAS